MALWLAKMNEIHFLTLKRYQQRLPKVAYITSSLQEIQRVHTGGSHLSRTVVKPDSRLARIVCQFFSLSLYNLM